MSGRIDRDKKQWRDAGGNVRKTEGKNGSQLKGRTDRC
jgi:hypothetical protein